MDGWVGGKLSSLFSYNHSPTHLPLPTGECHRAIQTFSEMRAAGLQPDVYALTVGIKACGVCGLVPQALEFIDEILAVRPTHPPTPSPSHQSIKTTFSPPTHPPQTAPAPQHPRPHHL